MAGKCILLKTLKNNPHHKGFQNSFALLERAAATIISSREL